MTEVGNRSLAAAENLGHRSSLWRIPPGRVVEAPVDGFSPDFQVMIMQLGEMLDCEPEILVIRSLPIPHFKKWAEEMPPDWDRYIGITAQAMYDAGAFMDPDYDSSKGLARLKRKMRACGLPDPYEYGFKLYVKQLAQAIEDGIHLPPVLTVKKMPMDGRHRVLAAVRLGLSRIPVADVAESCV